MRICIRRRPKNGIQCSAYCSQCERTNTKEASSVSKSWSATRSNISPTCILRSRSVAKDMQPAGALLFNFTCVVAWSHLLCICPEPNTCRSVVAETRGTAVLPGGPAHPAPASWDHCPRWCEARQCRFCREPVFVDLAPAKAMHALPGWQGLALHPEVRFA